MTEQATNWKDFNLFKVSHLIKLHPNMLKDGGHTIELSNQKKDLTALVTFDEDYVTQRLIGFLDDIECYNIDEAVSLMRFAYRTREESLELSKEEEIARIIAKYGEQAVKKAVES